MRIRFLGKGGSQDGGCPALYATDNRTYLAQGWRTAQPATIEIPHLLLGFAEPGTFVGAPLTDTGRGTFTLTGQPVTDTDTLRELELAEGETVIEVPRAERTYYGAVPQR